MKKKTLFKVITALVAFATLGIAVFIMANHIGLVDSLDFGAGAYYYADIPNFESYDPSFQTTVPRWVHIVLFLVWGALMFRLWTWVDKKNENEKVSQQ